MPKLTIRCSDDYYQLVRGNDESDMADYGDPVILDSGGKSYLAHVHETESGERISLLNGGDDWAVEVRKALDVEFEDGETESGDGEDDPQSDDESELEETDDDTDDDAGDPDEDDPEGDSGDSDEDQS